MARSISNVLSPIEARDRMTSKYRAYWKAVTSYVAEKNLERKAERLHAVLEANELLDDSYDMLRFSLLSDFLQSIERLGIEAQKNPAYLGMATQASEKAQEILKKWSRSEHEAMKKCDFLRRQAIHVKLSVKKVGNRLKGAYRKAVSAVKKKREVAQFGVKEGKGKKPSRKERQEAMKKMREAQPKGKRRKVDVVGGPDRGVVNY